MLRDYITTEFRFDDVEFTFLKLGDHSNVWEFVHDCWDMVDMIFFVIDVYHDVSQVYYSEDVEVFVDSVVCQVLECGQGVGETEWHDRVFEQAVANLEGC